MEMDKKKEEDGRAFFLPSPYSIFAGEKRKTTAHNTDNPKSDSSSITDHVFTDLTLRLGLGFESSGSSFSSNSSPIPSVALPLEIPTDTTLSLELTLKYDPWTMKKTIERSDIGDLDRLVLKKRFVETHIFSRWDDGNRRMWMREGLSVNVWDCDTDSEHKMVLKTWSDKYHVLIGKWRKEFVKRRSLKKGDEIGLIWDPFSFKFIFKILSRAPILN